MWVGNSKLTYTRSDHPPVPEKTAETVAAWLPYTLRWHYMLIPALTSLCLSVVTPYLIWYSQTYYGLGNDDGSSMILFGWRFTPTLIAVVYTQLTAMLLEDVKRTEPFARMARNSLGGASAATTVLQAPTAWWTALADGFSKKKNGGQRSGTLIYSATINIIAFLAISPLSSSLLSTQKISVSEKTEFTRMVPVNHSQIVLNPGRETYLRTTSSFLANLSATDWITDSYAVLPFWPSIQTPRLGQNIIDTPGAWQADTTVFSADLSCTNMSLLGMTSGRQTYSESWYNCSGNSTALILCMDPEGPYLEKIDGYVPLISTIFASTDGCKYGLEVPQNVFYAYPGSSGYVTWNNLSTVVGESGPAFDSMAWVIGNETSATMASSDFVHTNHSDTCGSKEVFLLTTPWTSSLSDYDQFASNHTISTNITFSCLLCSQTYYMAKIPVTLSKASGNTQVAIAEDDFLSRRTTVPETLLNPLDVQYLSLHENWSTAVGGTQDSQDDHILITAGIAAVLSSVFGNNITDMIGNPEVISQAARLRSLFFNELLLSSITTPDAFEVETTQGVQVTAQKKVIVVPGVGITLTILFGVSFFLYLFLYYCSGHQRRPLNVEYDPATTIGLAMLFDSRYCSFNLLQKLHRYQKEALKQSLQMQQYYMRFGKLYEAEIFHERDKSLNISNAMMACRWEPRVLRLCTLSALIALLVSLFAALFTLHQLAAGGILHQTAFVYRIDTSMFGKYWSTFSPISVAPTTIAVLTGLWWGAMDGALRSLEPYISMSRSPKDIASGAGLSYSAAYWFWASAKAAKKKSWGLACVTLGTTLSQILIVSLSALFEIQSGNSVRQLELHRTLEIRQIPVVSNLIALDSPSTDVTQKLYLNDSGSWIYGATNQLILNGTEPLWSLDEWSFVPFDLSQIPKGQAHRRYSDTSSDQSIPLSLSNVTINTPAIRARLECDPVDQVVDKSSWVSMRNISHPSQSLIKSKRPHIAYQIGSKIWRGTPFNTSILSIPVSPRCCVNESSDMRRSALGYWSATDSSTYPHADANWPVTFSSKWVLGNAQYFYDLGNRSQYTDVELERDFDPFFYPNDTLFFTEEPLMQAVHCSPIIETADADVTVDTNNGRVQSYRILNDSQPSDSPWLDVFVYHTTYNCDHLLGCGNETAISYPNITNSYGVHFIDALLGASFRAESAYRYNFLGDYDSEGMGDNAYSFKDRKRGLNLDLMTYAMYYLAGGDPEALLNSTTLIDLTQRVFQTFFQHFVSDGVSLIDGGWAYQKINESLPKDLPPPIDRNRNVAVQRQYPMLNTNRTTIANVSETINVLRMNSTATWLSTSILLWLLITTIVIVVMQYKHAHLMIRNVECIADVMVLIAGSDNFLKLIEERGTDLMEDKAVFTRLGWFRKIDGEVRYGIEVVGGENAVEWVEPSDDWVIAQRKGRGGIRRR